MNIFLVCGSDCWNEGYFVDSLFTTEEKARERVSYIRNTDEYKYVAIDGWDILSLQLDNTTPLPTWYL